MSAWSELTALVDIGLELNSVTALWIWWSK